MFESLDRIFCQTLCECVAVDANKLHPFQLKSFIRMLHIASCLGVFVVVTGVNEANIWHRYRINPRVPEESNPGITKELNSNGSEINCR